MYNDIQFDHSVIFVFVRPSLLYGRKNPKAQDFNFDEKEKSQRNLMAEIIYPPI